MLNPKNELGVIVIFSQICEENGYSITRIESGFPDATVTNNESGESFEVEFEFVSSNFAAHRHDPRECDIIVCWKNDLGKAIEGFPVICLSEEKTIVLFRVDDIQKELAYLRMRNKYLENKISLSNLHNRLPKEPGETERAVRAYVSTFSDGYIPSVRSVADSLNIPTSTVGVILKKIREERSHG